MLDTPLLTSNSNSANNTVQLESFQVSASEQNAVDSLNATLFNYVLMKEASSPENLLVDLKPICGMTLPNIPEQEYRICSIRRRGYYLFHCAILCGVYTRAATIRERRLFCIRCATSSLRVTKIYCAMHCMYYLHVLCT